MTVAEHGWAGSTGLAPGNSPLRLLSEVLDLKSGAGDAPALQRAHPCTLRVGSVLGREHLRLRRNNQDAVAHRTVDGITVAVVTDGCSSCRGSEVGAQLGARFLAQTVPALARRDGLSPALAPAATDGLLKWLYELARGLPVDGLAETVGEQLLFGFLCAATDGVRTLVFGVGDGVVFVDGRTWLLDPGPNNAPPYLAYRLVPSTAEVAACRPVLHFFGQARQVAVGTDGVADLLQVLPGGLGELFADQAMWKNPVHLQRRLNVLADRTHALRDDTTLALLLGGD